MHFLVCGPADPATLPPWLPPTLRRLWDGLSGIDICYVVRKLEVVMVCLQALSEEPWSSQPGPTYLDHWVQSFDPQGREYFWHVTQRRARTWSLPRGLVAR